MAASRLIFFAGCFVLAEAIFFWLIFKPKLEVELPTFAVRCANASRHGVQGALAASEPTSEQRDAGAAAAPKPTGEQRDAGAAVVPKPTSEQKDAVLSPACSRGSHIETHQESQHGDVCRGTEGGFSCPSCCIPTNSGPPFCALEAEPEKPCRVSQCVREASPTAGACTSAKDTIALVLRTWTKDARIGMRAMSSLVKVLPHQRYVPSVLIITDSESAEFVGSQVNEAKASGMFEPIEQSLVRLIVEEKFMTDGHIQQKYSKLTSDLYTDARYILHVDSDVFFSHWEEPCFFGGGKRHLPLLTYAPWNTLPPFLKQWKNGSEALLDLPNVEYEFSRLNQHVYPRQLYDALRKRVEKVQGKPFKSVFKDTPLVGTGDLLRSSRQQGFSKALLVSDFNLLGAVAHYLMPSLMFEDNLAVPPAPGVVRWAMCVRQCNARLFADECCMAWQDSIEHHMELHGNLEKYNCTLEFLPKATLACREKIRRNPRIVCDAHRLGS